MTEIKCVAKIGRGLKTHPVVAEPYTDKRGRVKYHVRFICHCPGTSNGHVGFNGVTIYVNISSDKATCIPRGFPSLRKGIDK